MLKGGGAHSVQALSEAILYWHGHCRKQCRETRIDDPSARSAENLLTFIFQVFGLALVALLCFVLYC